MQTDYNEQDTERARRMEGIGSSAGRQTQTLTPAAGLMPGHAANRNMPALALIVIGTVMFMSRFALGRIAVQPALVLLTIASCFLFFSFWRRVYGLLIPGCILAGLSVGVAFFSLTDGVSVLWGLALGFLAIHVVGRNLFNIRSPWPIYPAVPLFAAGVIMAISHMPTFFATGLVALPLLLIAAGLYLGWGRRTI